MREFPSIWQQINKSSKHQSCKLVRGITDNNNYVMMDKNVIQIEKSQNMLFIQTAKVCTAIATVFET